RPAGATGAPPGRRRRAIRDRTRDRLARCGRGEPPFAIASQRWGWSFSGGSGECRVDARRDLSRGGGDRGRDRAPARRGSPHIRAPTVCFIALSLVVALLISGRRPHTVVFREAAAWSVFYIAVALLFGVVFGF